MPKKLTSVLGIDIGSQQIKIAEVKMQGKEPAITALGIADTPEGAVDHTGVYDTDSVSKVLKDLIASSGVSVPSAVISVAGQASVLVRTLEVPRMNPTELKEHMQWEITRNIPFAESTIVSDFKAFEPTDAAAQNMDVVMAISPQSAVDALVTLVKKAGKTLAAIDVEPLGIARSLAVSYGEQFSGQTLCVVEIGHKTTSINMYRDGQLLMPRQVPIGGENFTRTLVDSLGIDFAEAEELKRTRGGIPESAGVLSSSASPFAAPAETQGFQPYNPFADDTMLMGGGTEEPNPFAEPTIAAASPNPFEEPGQAPSEASAPPQLDAGAYGAMTPEPIAPPVDSADPEMIRVFNAMSTMVDEFLSEVRRSIDYFRSKGGEVNRIVICGGGSKLRGLDAFLAKTLGIPCEVYDPMKGISMGAKRLDAETLEHNRPDFAIAVGNGLHVCFE